MGAAVRGFAVALGVTIALSTPGCGSNPPKEDAGPGSTTVVEAREGSFVFLGIPEALFNENRNQSRQRVMIGYHVTSDRRCDDITFMQAVQITQGDGTHTQPSPGQRRRMTTDGWAIDQSKDGADVNPHPWYPLNPDGTFNPNLGAMGKSGATMTDAELKDAPYSGAARWPRTYRYLSAAICRDPPPLTVLDVVSWTFAISKDGSVSKARAQAATAAEKTLFKEAADAWDKQATTNPAVPGQTPIGPLKFP